MTGNLHIFFRENAYHGDADFHFSLYSIHNTDTRKILVHRHWHEEIEIVYVQSGAMRIEIAGEKRTLNAGEIMLIPPEQIHEFTKSGTQNCKFYSLVFQLSLLLSPHSTVIHNKYLRALGHSQRIYCFDQQHPANPLVLALVNHIISLYYEQPFGYELMVSSDLFAFFFHVLQQDVPAIQKDNHLTPTINMRIKKIVNYLEANYSNKITLADMAELIGTSREHFSRFFKNYFQMNFSEYLTTFRVSKATYLLVTTSWSILDVAIASGFNNASYFTNVFTAIMKLTPSAYRKKHQIK